uniref:Uncharacterized protein n=1 Tax=Lutzomyia longipalpis TaxID=7200 RepID=A0A1B0CCV2_LUTLO
MPLAVLPSRRRNLFIELHRGKLKYFKRKHKKLFSWFCYNSHEVGLGSFSMQFPLYFLALYHLFSILLQHNAFDWKIQRSYFVKIGWKCAKIALF